MDRDHQQCSAAEAEEGAARTTLSNGTATAAYDGKIIYSKVDEGFFFEAYIAAEPKSVDILKSGTTLTISIIGKQQRVPLRGVGRNSYWDDEVASGVITANMSDTYEGWLDIELGQLQQRIFLVARPRHFGGHQWFFACPYLNRRAMVLGCLGSVGTGKSDMPLNSSMGSIAPTGARQRSIRGFARSVT